MVRTNGTLEGIRFSTVHRSVGLGGGGKGDVLLFATCLLLKFVGMFMVADSWLGASDFT